MFPMRAVGRVFSLEPGVIQRSEWLAVDFILPEFITRTTFWSMPHSRTTHCLRGNCGGSSKEVGVREAAVMSNGKHILNSSVQEPQSYLPPLPNFF